jgi:hypothetical protein
VFELKEVKERAKFLHSKKGDKARISLFILSRPSTLSPYYLIQIGYSSEIRFEVYLNFRLNKKFAEKKDIQNYIEIMNLESEYISLLKWRKLKK